MKKFLLILLLLSFPCYAQDNLYDSFYKELHQDQKPSEKALLMKHSATMFCSPSESTKTIESYSCINEIYRIACLKLVNKKTKQSEIYCSVI